MRSLWRLRSFARPYLWALWPVLLAMALTAATGAWGLLKTRPLFEAVFAAPGDMDPGERLRQAAVTAAAVLGLLTLSSICDGAGVYGSEWIGQQTLLNLRRTLFRRLEGLSIRFFEGRHSGEMVSRLNTDTTILQSVMGIQVGTLVLAPMNIIAAMGGMFWLSWRVTLLVVILGPTVGALTSLMGRRIRRYSLQFQERLAQLSVVVEESFSLMRVIKIFGLEQHAARRFEDTAHSVMKTELRAVRVRALNTPVVGAFVGFAVGGALLLCTYEVIQGRLFPSDALTFVLLMQRAGSEIKNATRSLLQVQRAEASAQRTLELLDVVPDIVDEPGARPLTAIRGEVRFENVSFEYSPGTEVIRNLNLTIHPGEVVALVGPSGSGKTTVANLLARLYDATRGRVLIDGTDVRHITQESLRRQMGIVPQEPALFSGTVRENIALGLEGATDEQIEAAARAADADAFIRSLPEGYDTQVGERGGKLSGGQRQRIAIARAVLRDPRILILDEATSSLDRASEAVVLRAIEGLLHGRTALIIAHRLSTVRNADRIVVLSDGRIVEQGSHVELLAADGLYRGLYESQDVQTEDGRERTDGEPPPQLAG